MYKKGMVYVAELHNLDADTYDGMGKENAKETTVSWAAVLPVFICLAIVLMWFCGSYLPSHKDVGNVLGIVVIAVLDLATTIVTVMYINKYRKQLYRFKHSDGICDAKLVGWKVHEYRDKDTNSIEYRYTKIYEYQAGEKTCRICRGAVETERTGNIGNTIKIRYDLENPEIAFADIPHPILIIILLFVILILTINIAVIASITPT